MSPPKISSQSDTYRLLDDKVQEAAKALAAQCEMTLYSGDPMAMTTGVYTPTYTTASHTHSILPSPKPSGWNETYHGMMVWDAAAPKPEKEKKVTSKATATSAMERRRKKRADDLTDYLVTAFESYDLTDGDVIRWSAKYMTGDTVYHYVAVLGSNNVWYVTYDRTMYSRDDLIVHIVAMAMDAEVFFEGSDEPL